MRSVYPGGRLNEINKGMSSKLILEETVDSTRKMWEEKYLQKFIFYTFDTLLLAQFAKEKDLLFGFY